MYIRLNFTLTALVLLFIVLGYMIKSVAQEPLVLRMKVNVEMTRQAVISP